MSSNPTLLLTSKASNLQNDEKDRGSDSGTDTSEEHQMAASEEYTFFGIDFKPALPSLLRTTTIVGALCMVPLYMVTLSLMIWTTFSGPGQILTVPGENGDLEEGLQYPRPIRQGRSKHVPPFNGSNTFTDGALRILSFETFEYMWSTLQYFSQNRTVPPRLLSLWSASPAIKEHLLCRVVLVHFFEVDSFKAFQQELSPILPSGAMTTTANG
jgi:hypothetical protein